jgi:hypothetical protein
MVLKSRIINENTCIGVQFLIFCFILISNDLNRIYILSWIEKIKHFVIIRAKFELTFKKLKF